MTDNNSNNNSNTSDLLQTSITTMPPCSSKSRLVEDEADHRVQAAALTEAMGISLAAAIIPPANENAVLMTTIGLGIDPFFGSTSITATFAAIKAVRDAMERTILRFPADNSNLRLHVQLGVPPRTPHLTETMHVDVSQITPLLPSFVPLLPIEVVVGGLLAGASTSPQLPSGSHNVTCTVVACISLRKISHPVTMPDVVRAPDFVSIAPSTQRPAHHDVNHQPMERKAIPARVEAGSDTSKPCAASMEAAEVLSGSLSQTRKASPEPSGRNNIDVLAHISAELHEGEPMTHRRINSQTEDAAGNYNYKKLPPGMTSKKNKRLFVKHSYRDYSHDLPLPDEVDLVDSLNNNTRTVNAAFPLKLHETLSLIEKDGNGHIIGWLPHGRSFKIHQQKEFVELILEKYFMTTKKSSFLRQLNLYGFNRLSGTGSDQGSYYHEKFLRGMKFLCRRIHRQKVNGNGIRAAGNPEGEPNLSLFPSCPLNASERRLLVEQASATRSPSSCSPVGFTRENGSLSSPTASTSFHLATKTQQDFLGEDDRMHEDQSSAGDSGFSEAAKSAQPAASFINASFPLKLHCILDKLEAEGSNDIISWLPHGRAFLVSNVDRFVEEIMRTYFNQSRYASFQRQLHMYHFQRITAGRDKGAYHHPSFLRGCSDLCLSMTRTRVNGKGTRRPGNPEGEPDFYEMDAMPAIPLGTIIEFPTDVSSLEQTNEVKKRGRVSSCGSESS